MPQHVLTVNDLTKIFETDQDDVLAVDRVSFELSGDEFFTMLGPSGRGKTTTLRMISGLEAMTSGSIFFDGEDFSGLEEGGDAALIIDPTDMILFHRGGGA